MKKEFTDEKGEKWEIIGIEKLAQEGARVFHWPMREKGTYTLCRMMEKEPLPFIKVGDRVTITTDGEQVALAVISRNSLAFTDGCRHSFVGTTWLGKKIHFVESQVRDLWRDEKNLWSKPS